VVETITKVTAVPRPIAVSILFEQTRNEHIPRKLAKRILLVKIEPIKITIKEVLFIILLPVFIECV
jgi:hypothetical protein